MFRPALDVNNGLGKPSLVRVTTAISSLNDADIFINSRIRSDGTFNCYLGEEIIIDNAVWQVVGVDTELGKGDIPLTRHHITLVPRNFLCMDKIHNINDNCNGYANSDMHRYIIPSIVSKQLEHVLGDHLLERRVKLSSGTSPHAYMASANEHYSVKANLMCQMQVFGTVDSSYGNEYDTGDDTTQLPGFATGKVASKTGSWWWLRDVYGYTGSGYYFGYVRPDGSLNYGTVNHSVGGVRPLITIG